MGQEQRDLFDKQPPPWELDDQREACVAAVVFADAPFGPYDYEVPAALRSAVQPGVRVQVPLGRGNRKRVGYCTAVENQTHPQRALKPIIAVVDAQSLLSPAMLRLTQWMASYYLCPLGQVLDAVVPAGVRGQAGTREQVFLRVPTRIAARLTQLKLPAKQAPRAADTGDVIAGDDTGGLGGRLRIARRDRSRSCVARNLCRRKSAACSQPFPIGARRTATIA